MQFKGTKNYIATEDLSLAVNAAAANNTIWFSRNTIGV